MVQPKAVPVSSENPKKSTSSANEIGKEDGEERDDRQTETEKIPTWNSLTRRNIMHNSKLLNDPVHGHIEIPSLCIRVIDTPQFQRLRNIKQLGTTYWVFPGASHNRFEHSIGVCHLAGELVKSLQRRQPSLKITEADVLCVQLAGLCHDLGHGPFSHFFEHAFIHVLDPASAWSHEKASIMMLDYLIEKNNLWPAFKKNNLSERDVIFIKEMIYGLLPSNHYECLTDNSMLEKLPTSKIWKLKGRSANKRYLYEIVANKRNGIDVDKFDYFSRDCHHLNIKNNFDHIRWIKFARVIEVEGQLQLCTRDKEVSNLYDLFSTRHSLHRRAYQHKVVKVIDYMFGEILVAANDHLLFEDDEGNTYKMSESIWNMNVYQQLTDSVMERILWSKNKALAAAQKIIRDVQSRRLYRCIGLTTVLPKHICLADISLGTLQLANICNQLIQMRKLEIDRFVADHLVVHVVNMDYGKKSQNPIDYVRFYTKAEPNFGRRVKKDHVSKMLPENFSEKSIRVFCKRRDMLSVNLAKEAFQEWAREKDLPAPIDSGDTFGIDLSETEEREETGSTALCSEV